MHPLDKLIALEKESREYGFYWPHAHMIIEQAISECSEIKEALDQKESPQRVQEEIGDLLHTAISLCIYAGFDVEETIISTEKKFSSRMSSLKEVALEKGLRTLQGQPTEYLLTLWGEVKRREKAEV